MTQISEYFRNIFFPNLGITLKNIGDHISIGSFEIRFYGIIIMIGFLLAYVLVTKEAKRTGQNPETYLDFILILIIPAILGARLYYILFRLDQYIVKGDVGATIKAMLNIRGGGLAIYGGIIAGIITAVIFCKVRKVNFVLMLILPRLEYLSDRYLEDLEISSTGRHLARIRTARWPWRSRLIITDQKEILTIWREPVL